MKNSKNDDVALVAFFALCLGAAGAIFGVDQQNKRVQDQQRHRAELGAVQERMILLQGQLKDAIKRLGNQNSQVLALMSELTGLQRKAALLQPLAG